MHTSERHAASARGREETAEVQVVNFPDIFRTSVRARDRVVRDQEQKWAMESIAGRIPASWDHGDQTACPSVHSNSALRLSGFESGNLDVGLFTSFHNLFIRFPRTRSLSWLELGSPTRKPVTSQKLKILCHSRQGCR